jgi:hypothetical protein
MRSPPPLTTAGALAALMTPRAPAGAAPTPSIAGLLGIGWSVPAPATSAANDAGPSSRPPCGQR